MSVVPTLNGLGTSFNVSLFLRIHIMYIFMFMLLSGGPCRIGSY